MSFSAEDTLERKKHKVALLEDKLAQQQLETVRLVHEKEVQAEKCVQLQEEIQFLRDNQVDDVSSHDQERLEQLELIQRLRASEIELQSQLEAQQRKWSTDRTAIHQQMRLLEKEKQLAEDERKHVEAERAAVLKKNGTVLTSPAVLCRSLSILTQATHFGISRCVGAAKDCFGGASRGNRCCETLALQQSRGSCLPNRLGLYIVPTDSRTACMCVPVW